MHERHNKIKLVACGAASLVLTTAANRLAGIVLNRAAPGGAWIATAAIPSCLVLFGLYSIAAAKPFAPPRAATEWRRIFRAGAVWLAVWIAARIVLAAASGNFAAYAHGAPELAAFLIFGLLGEEMLFRGVIFELAERAFPAQPPRAVWISAAFFSLHHFELHNFALTNFALAQVAFTFPMGLVFGDVRRLSNSLYPALALHFLTNLAYSFGG